MKVAELTGGEKVSDIKAFWHRWWVW